ncbi:Sodium/glutamate symport protein [Klebsiella variicola]|nr:Sodium/glutamate symport protein [Klebsiella variicola]
MALALLVLKKSMDIEIDFDMSLKDPLMLAFFATSVLTPTSPACGPAAKCWALS